jgi:hypothetical protein
MEKCTPEDNVAFCFETVKQFNYLLNDSNENL